jgi:hypothetical protein
MGMGEGMMGLAVLYCNGGVGTCMEVSDPLASERVTVLQSHMLEEQIRIIQVKHMHPLRNHEFHVEVQPEPAELVLVPMPTGIAAALTIVDLPVLFVR